jgi:hypothetical protein
LIFGVIYLNVPAGATIYMVVSSAMRIGTQDLMFRTGMVTAVGTEKEREREIGGASKSTRTAALTESTEDVKPTGKGTVAPKNTNGAKGASTNGKGATNGRRPPAGKRPTAGKATANGKASSNGSTEDETTAAPKPHPRSRSKKERKAR